MQSTWDLTESRVLETSDVSGGFRPWATRLVTLTLMGVMTFGVIAGNTAWRATVETAGLRASSWAWNDPFDYLRLFSHQLIHGSGSHFFWNTFILLLTGFVVERRNGSVATVAVLLFGGTVAAISHLLFFPEETRVLIGASGAVSALMGMAFVSAGDLAVPIRMPRRSRVYFRISLRLGLGMWVALQVVALTRNVILAADGAVSVAYWSHIAGFAAGAVAIALLRSRTSISRPAGSDPAPASMTAGD